MEIEPVKQNPELPSAVIVDIDGTLALRTTRGVFEFGRAGEDVVNVPVLNAVNVLGKAYRIIFVTGREDLYRDVTTNWLAEKCGIVVDETTLLMRPTKDFRPDFVVKEEIYKQHIIPNFYIQFCLDDRQQVVDHIRSIGLTVFQVAPNQF